MVCLDVAGTCSLWFEFFDGSALLVSCIGIVKSLAGL